MLNRRDELLESCRHRRKHLLVSLFPPKKKEPPDITVKQQGEPKHLFKILQKSLNFKPNSILILDLTYIQLQFQSGIQIFPPFSKGSKMFQNLLKCKQLGKIQFSLVQAQLKMSEEGEIRKRVVTSYSQKIYIVIQSD